MGKQKRLRIDRRLQRLNPITYPECGLIQYAAKVCKPFAEFPIYGLWGGVYWHGDNYSVGFSDYDATVIDEWWNLETEWEDDPAETWRKVCNIFLLGIAEFGDADLGVNLKFKAGLRPSPKSA